MIIGIGVDTVNINRCAKWNLFSSNRLIKLFHPTELQYILSHKHLSAERFAVRFAAKEAFTKAIRQQLAPNIPFLSVCKFAYINKNSKGIPFFVIDWNSLLSITDFSYKVHLSITHSKDTATAFVVIESLDMIN